MATGGAPAFSNPDQPERCAGYRASALTDPVARRYCDIDAVYDPTFLKDRRVVVTGANRGLGLALATELEAVGAVVIATCRRASPELEALEKKGVQVIRDVDVTQSSSVDRMAAAVVEGGSVDVLINNAGVFIEAEETLEDMRFDDELMMIDVCAVGPLRVTSALHRAGALRSGCRVVINSSQGGSIAWRTAQNPKGHDYGHHMSKAAANMAGVLLAQELRPEGVMVALLHPGFNRTDMTSKYSEVWDKEGAVDASVGAKRVLHEVGQLTMGTTGSFVNCEDGLRIPW